MRDSQLEITPKEVVPATAKAQARPNLNSQAGDWGSGRAGSSRPARRPKVGEMAAGPWGLTARRGPGSGARRELGGTRGAALTHEEAEEVEADEQHPLAAALPRVVVERRAAAVLTLRDDRLVVLVTLHGAGCGKPPGRCGPPLLRSESASSGRGGECAARPCSSNCRRG